MPALIASYTSAAGGSERSLLDVARGLEEPPLIACPGGWLADQARGSGLTVFELRQRSLHVRRSTRDRLASTTRLAGHAREIHRLVRDVRPEFVVAWGMRPALATVAALRPVEDAPPWVFQHVDFLPAGPIGAAVRRAVAGAARIVCVSQAVADDLDPSGSLRSKLEVIHAGVDLERFAPSDRDRRAAAAPDRTPGQPAPGYVLTLGAIVDWKRPDLALEIAAAAARELPDLRLRMVGSPLDAADEPLLERLKHRAAEPDLAGRVEFSGAVADPAELLREAGCLLHCSEHEPFGLVLVEALASGTPVVAPTAGGPGEIVDSTCGSLYPPGDAAAGVAALVATMRRRDELRDQARARAERDFSLAQMQQRYRARFARIEPRSESAGAGIAFVTVTYNSGRELARLAASINRYMPGARLIVVDNASADDSVAVAEAGGATVVRNQANRGFGAAANAGVATVSEPVTVLVNPDVELVDSSLAGLAEHAQPGRLLAPLLLDPDGSRQDSAHPRPASPATALYSLLPGAALPRVLRTAVEPWQSRRPRRVGWATAACLVASTGTLRQLGPFDESIFLYAEDLDLGLRAETWFHPEARVIHSRAHSTEKEFGGENYELLAKQRRDVIRRRLGGVRAIVDDLIELMTFADRAALRVVAGRSARRETQRFRARVRAAVQR